MKRENTLTHGSLFSGIGGVELGAERARIPVLFAPEQSTEIGIESFWQK